MMRKVLLVLLFGCALAAHAASEVTPERLAQADRLLTHAQHHPAQRADDVARAQALLPAGACPSLPRADAHPEALSRAQAEVHALGRVLAPAPSAPGAGAHGRLREVLAQPEYHQLQHDTYHLPPAVMGWTDRLGAFFTWVGHGIATGWTNFWRWVGSKMPHWRSPSSMPSPNLGWLAGLGQNLRTILTVIVVVVALLLLGLLANALMQWSERRKERAGALEADDEVSEDPTTRRRQEPSFWERSLTRAEALWATGEQREAMRILYRACLVLLDARGVLRYEEARANGEVLWELRRLGRAALYEAMRPIVRDFDRSWYGFLPLASDDFTRALEQSRRLRATMLEER